MAIKIFCDICGEEQDQYTFSCEMMVQEVVCDIQDLTPMNKRLKKTQLQVCKKCYDANIANKLNKTNATS
jgi:hypothetical protein